MNYQILLRINYKLSALERLNYDGSKVKDDTSNITNKLFNDVSKIYPKQKPNLKALSKDNNTMYNGNKILIVDDEVDLTRLFRLALEKEGFVVDVFDDPVKAYSSYKSGYYDLLLLDVRMPEMSGFELYQKIKDIGDNTDVCFITAFEEYYDEFKKCFPSLQDVDCFIRKPVGMDKLVKFIKNRLSCKDN